MNIPEPVLKTGSHGKVFPVLGQKGVIHEGHITAEAGSGVSGMVFYVYECYGDEAWDPRVKDGKITGRFTVRDVFGGKAKCNIIFCEKSLDRIKELVPDIANIPYAVEK